MVTEERDWVDVATFGSWNVTDFAPGSFPPLEDTTVLLVTAVVADGCVREFTDDKEEEDGASGEGVLVISAVAEDGFSTSDELSGLAGGSAEREETPVHSSTVHTVKIRYKLRFCVTFLWMRATQSSAKISHPISQIHTQIHTELTAVRVPETLKSSLSHLALLPPVFPGDSASSWAQSRTLDRG